MRPKSEIRQSEINWRRNQVIELAAEGCSQKEIAQKLQLPPATIYRDMVFLKEQAMKNIEEWTTKRLPFQYRLTITAVEKVVGQMWQIANNSKDNQEKMEALLCFIDCHYKLIHLFNEGHTMEVRHNYSELAGNGNGNSKAKSMKGLVPRLPSPGDMITPKEGSSWIYRDFGQSSASASRER